MQRYFPQAEQVRPKAEETAVPAAGAHGEKPSEITAERKLPKKSKQAIASASKKLVPDEVAELFLDRNLNPDEFEKSLSNAGLLADLTSPSDM